MSIGKKIGVCVLAALVTVTVTFLLCAWLVMHKLKEGIFPLSRVWGYENISDAVYVEGNGSRLASEAEALAREAREDIRLFWGNQATSPTLLFCETQACASSWNVQFRAKAYDDVLLVIAPTGRYRHIVAHELHHSEVWRRLGTTSVAKRIPLWFHEGLATMASRDPRLQAPDCTQGMDISAFTALTTDEQFQKKTSQEGFDASYGLAAKQVTCWFKLAGIVGLEKLLQDVRQGITFDAAYQERVKG